MTMTMTKMLTRTWTLEIALLGTFVSSGIKASAVFASTPATPAPGVSASLAQGAGVDGGVDGGVVRADERTKADAGIEDTIVWVELKKTDLPKAARFDGEFDRAIKWVDGRGENYTIFSSKLSQEPHSKVEDPTSTRRLWVHHYLRFGGRLSLRREVKDAYVGCPADLEVGFVPEALGLTDLDHDQTAELTFAYRLGCRFDVSPVDLKLLMLEDGEKYILRGVTRIPEVEPIGGEYTIDPSFSQAPAAFLEHARQLWNKIVTERF